MRVSEKTLDRSDVEALAAGGAPVHLVSCDLNEVDLAALNLIEWTFEKCDLRRANFGGSRLGRSRWISCRGAFASFSDADLSEAVFTASDFNNALFRRATLTSASFEECKLTGADLVEARPFDLHFAGTLLINARLPGYDFRKQTLRRIDLSQADLRKCDFRATVFEECSLRDAMMDGARFEGADLRGADIGGLRLMDAARFRGATISRSQAEQLLRELSINVR